MGKVKTVLVDCPFKSKADAIAGMSDGRIYRFDGAYCKMFDDPGTMKVSFRLCDRDGKNPRDHLMGFWDAYDRAQVLVTKEVEWYDEIDPCHPIPCWVSDESASDKKRIEMVVEYDEEDTSFPFHTLTTIFTYATPVKKGELDLLK